MPVIDTASRPSFLAAHAGRMPPGDVAFLGAGSAAEIVRLARQGYRITVFEADSSRLNATRVEVEAAGVAVRWHLAPCPAWQLGFERWVGVIVLFPHWRLAEQRRLLRQVPCALKPGGCFLFEGFAEGPGGPLSLAGNEHDPEEFRDALDVLHLARCHRVFRAVRQDPSGPRWILQVLGRHLPTHGEAAGDVPQPLARFAQIPSLAARH